MSEADWTLMSDSLSSGTLKSGVTNGIARPNGGGNFVFGFNSVANNGNNPGAAGYFVDLVNYAPTAANKGGSVRAAIQRGLSSSGADFAPMIAVGIQGGGPSVNDQAYILGISDAEPAHIVLRKGTIIGGVPDVSPGTSGVLRRSNATYAMGTWLHLRLDMIVNLVGDVLLQCFMNDLNSNPVTAPVWAAIPGMDSFNDDALAINSGSAPFTSGYMGLAFWMKNIGRRGFFDHFVAQRQT